MSNSSDTDQALHFVGPDPGPALGSYQQTTLLGGGLKSFFVECVQIQSKDESILC